MEATFETAVRLVLDFLGAYAGIGVFFAVPFVWVGVPRLDAEAEGAGIGFRLLIFPGVIAFWPVLLGRWLRRIPEPPIEVNPHRNASER